MSNITLFSLLVKISRYIKNLITIHRFKLLIFFVTNRCNAKCKTCFYWGNLNKEVDELSIEEIKAISSYLGRFDTIQISGGEPFLRDDLDKICEIFYKNNRITAINIPTNCLLPEKIYATTEKILQVCPKASITLCCALDGIGKTHDEIRGVEGNFEKFKVTIDLLKQLEKKYSNFTMFALTTLCKDNYAEYDRIVEFVKVELNINHNVDFTRQHTAEYEQIEDVPTEVIKKINTDNLDKLYLYSKHNILRGIVQIGGRKIFNKILENAREGREWPLRCFAGRTTVVLEPNGDVRLCEHRGIVGDVRKANYNIFKVLKGKKAISMKKEIIKSHCSCDHSVFINLSINSSRYYKIMELVEGLRCILWLR